MKLTEAAQRVADAALGVEMVKRIGFKLWQANRAHDDAQGIVSTAELDAYEEYERAVAEYEAALKEEAE